MASDKEISCEFKIYCVQGTMETKGEVSDTSLGFFFESPNRTTYGRLVAEDTVPRQLQAINVDSLCIRLSDFYTEAVEHIVPGVSALIKSDTHLGYLSAGLGASTTISANDFRRFTEGASHNPIILAALYTQSFDALTSAIQSGFINLERLLCDFYRKLCTDPQHLPSSEILIDHFGPNDTIERHGEYASELMSVLSSIYIQMASILDYLAKIDHELSSPKEEFSTFCRMKSRRITFETGGYKEPFYENTIFSQEKLVNEIMSIRNLVIHNAMIDSRPRYYVRFSEGEVAERYMLFPDLNEHGRLASIKDRELFYSNNDKINLRLPDLVIDFEEGCISLIKKFIEHLRERYRHNEEADKPSHA